jgi:hypothetical protein
MKARFNKTLFVILAFTLISSQSWAGFQIGDLVFMHLSCYVCSLIEKTTGSPFSHVGIIDQDAAGHWVIMMAGDPKVSPVSLQYMMSRLSIKPVVKRMRTLRGQQLARTAAFYARQYAGTPYDYNYILGTDRLYCSELIYFAFMNANGGRPVFPVKRMTFGAYAAQWTGVLGHPPPEGQLGLSPADIARSPLLETISH